MPDWLALLADRFPRETLQPCKHQEVLLEISGHLQDYYDALVSEGIAEADAAEQTLRKLGIWISSNWRSTLRSMRGIL